MVKFWYGKNELRGVELFIIEENGLRGGNKSWAASGRWHSHPKQPTGASFMSNCKSTQ